MNGLVLDTEADTCYNTVMNKARSACFVRAVYLIKTMQIYDDPKFALVQVDGGFLVERFNPEIHLSKEYGWSRANVTLFSEMEEVAHLRSEILN